MDGGVAFAGVTTRDEGVKVTGEIGFAGHPMLEHFKFIAAHTRRTPRSRARAVGALRGTISLPSIKRFIPKLDTI